MQPQCLIDQMSAILHAMYEMSYGEKNSFQIHKLKLLWPSFVGFPMNMHTYLPFVRWGERYELNNQLLQTKGYGERSVQSIVAKLCLVSSLLDSSYCFITITCSTRSTLGLLDVLKSL